LVASIVALAGVAAITPPILLGSAFVAETLGWLLERVLPLATASDRKKQLAMIRTAAVTIRQFDVDLRMRILIFSVLKS
jgi:hypothetical protein